MAMQRVRGVLSGVLALGTGGFLAFQADRWMTHRIDEAQANRRLLESFASKVDRVLEVQVAKVESSAPESPPSTKSGACPAGSIASTLGGPHGGML